MYLDFGRPEWIVVEPQLTIKNQPVQAKQLTMQTLLSRSMGNLDRWDDLIRMQTTIGSRLNFLLLAKF